MGRRVYLSATVRPVGVSLRLPHLKRTRDMGKVACRPPGVQLKADGLSGLDALRELKAGDKAVIGGVTVIVLEVDDGKEGETQ